MTGFRAAKLPSSIGLLATMLEHSTDPDERDLIAARIEERRAHNRSASDKWKAKHND